MKRNKSHGFVAISVALLLVATGQISATASSYTYTSDKASLSAGINGDAVSAKLGEVNPSGKKYKIAVVLKALTNQYWQGIEQGA
jgi:ribose transport system substrate-binding protein